MSSEKRFRMIDIDVDNFEDRLWKEDYPLYQLMGMQIALNKVVTAKAFKIKRKFEEGFDKYVTNEKRRK